MLPVVCVQVVAWSSFGSVAMRYVLPVLWMTSCFRTVSSVVSAGFDKFLLGSKVGGFRTELRSPEWGPGQSPSGAYGGRSPTEPKHFETLFYP